MSLREVGEFVFVEKSIFVFGRIIIVKTSNKSVEVDGNISSYNVSNVVEQIIRRGSSYEVVERR